MSTPASHTSKTTVTSQTLLIPADELPAYEAHLARFFAEFSPETDREKELTQNSADTQWRINRTMALHMGIFALGQRELAPQFANEPDLAIRKSLIDAQIFINYQRHIKNLSTEEKRLRAQFETDRTELKALVEKRLRDHRQQISKALDLWENAQKEGLPFNEAEWKRIHIREGNYYTWLKQQQQRKAA
jgi:hypothetical protein